MESLGYAYQNTLQVYSSNSNLLHPLIPSQDLLAQWGLRTLTTSAYYFMIMWSWKPGWVIWRDLIISGMDPFFLSIYSLNIFMFEIPSTLKIERRKLPNYHRKGNLCKLVQSIAFKDFGIRIQTNGLTASGEQISPWNLPYWSSKPPSLFLASLIIPCFRFSNTYVDSSAS